MDLDINGVIFSGSISTGAKLVQRDSSKNMF
jgi:hypothetical protein